MDPNETYQRWWEAVTNGDREEAQWAAEDLAEWRENGGFSPDWQDHQEAAFLAWCDEYGVRLRPSSGTCRGVRVDDRGTER